MEPTPVSSGMNGDLVHDLTESLRLASSPDQMELAETLGLFTKTEQQELERYYKVIAAGGQLQNIHGAIETIIKVRDKYRAQMETLRARPLATDQERIDLFEQLQSLSERLDNVLLGETNLEIDRSLRCLRDSWKKKNVQNIVGSIAASRQFEHCRLVKVSRSNVATLGLGLRSFHKQYLVFDPATTTDEDRKAVILDIVQDFKRVFEENAVQNLHTMEALLRQDNGGNSGVGRLILDIQQISYTIFRSPTPSMSSSCASSEPGQQQQHRVLGTHHHHRQHHASSYLFDMAGPVFEPAAWDWPQLLKRKGRCRWWTMFLFVWSQKQHQAPYTCSLSRLSSYFARIGREYYTNMLNNARLGQSHQARLLQYATDSLLECHRALQIEHGYANLARVLVLLYQLQQESSRRMLTSFSSTTCNTNTTTTSSSPPSPSPPLPPQRPLSTVTPEPSDIQIPSK